MISVEKISQLIKGQIIGDKAVKVKDVCDIEKGKLNCITYIGHNKYKKYLKNNKASVVIVNYDFEIDNNKVYIKTKNPSYSFMKVMKLFHPSKNKIDKISKLSNIHSSVKVGKNVYIGPFVNIEKNSVIANNVIIQSGCYIGENTIIGIGTRILSNVAIYHDCLIGKNCKIDSGTVIGANGFGLIKYNSMNMSVPHIGKVVIKDDVYIGSNCSIDRGTIQDTVIENNCRLDNLIQIGHNVKIGKRCVIAAQVGIAGSSTLENDVTIAGQVGIVDHICIGSNTVITAKSLVCNSVGKTSFLSGNPAQPHRSFLKQQLMLRKLETKK